MAQGNPSTEAKRGLAGWLELRVGQGEQNKDSACFIPACTAWISSSVHQPLRANGEGCFQKHLLEQNVTGACNPFPAACWLARGAPSIPKPCLRQPAVMSLLSPQKPGVKRERCGVLLLFNQRYGCTELPEVFPCSRLALMVQILAAGFIGSSHPVAMTAILLLP